MASFHVSHVVSGKLVGPLHCFFCTTQQLRHCACFPNRRKFVFNSVYAANNAWGGVESIQIFSLKIMSSLLCRFPSWSEGHWEDLYIDSSTLVFQDRRNFKENRAFKKSIFQHIILVPNLNMLVARFEISCPQLNYIVLIYF